MRLADFISAHIEPILAEWEVFAREIWPHAAGGATDPATLRDDAESMLRAAVTDMQSEQTAAQQSGKSKGKGDDSPHQERVDRVSSLHGSERHDSGFGLPAVIAEYRALRSSVIRLWSESHPDPDVLDVKDLTRFNESIDQSLTQAVLAFVKVVERERQAAVENELRQTQQVREVNEVLLVSNVRLHELTEQALQATQALHESEAKYRAIFDGAAVSLWQEDFSAVKAAIDELTAAGVRDYPRYFQQHPEFVEEAISLIRVVAVNDASVRMFEARSPAELLGNLPNIFTPASLPVFIQELIAVAQGRTFLQGEALLKTVRGNPIWVLFTMTMAPERFDQVLFSLLDIRRLKEAEEATARLAAIVTSSDDAIISKNLDGVITSWNNGAERLFGYAAGEVIGQPVTLLIPDDHLAEEPQILERIRRGEAVEQYETVRKRKDGSLLDVSLTVSPLRDAAGRIIGASKIARDITERHRLEQQTQEQAAILADLHRRKDEFLAMLSHELRNPLAPISNAVHLLQLRKNESPLQQQACEVIERQVGQMVRLIDDLLEVSRITTGRIHLHKEQIAINGVVQNAVGTVRAQIEQRRHSLELALPPEPILLYADAARLEQVIVNLLTNAAKYMDEGGKIWLSVSQEGEEAIIRVRDTGVGIAPELLPRIFDLFTQAERSLDRSQGGLGIGLCLVQRLVEMHQGSVEAHSTLGQGSEFVVRLPVMQTTPPRSLRPRASVAAAATSLRVLVVDDRRDASHMLSTLLSAHGHAVRVAVDGPTALDAALDFLPQVVLLDIGLPGMSGYEVAQRIRQEPTHAGVCLVAVTGYGQESDRQQSRQAGFDHHLVKPADFRQVQEVLASVTQKISAARPTSNDGA